MARNRNNECCRPTISQKQLLAIWGNGNSFRRPDPLSDPYLFACFLISPSYRQMRRIFLSSAFRRYHGKSSYLCLCAYRTDVFIGSTRRHRLQARSQAQAQGPLALKRSPVERPRYRLRVRTAKTDKILRPTAPMRKSTPHHCNFFASCYIDLARRRLRRIVIAETCA